MDNIWIGNYKLHVNMPRLNRALDGKKQGNRHNPTIRHNKKVSIVWRKKPGEPFYA